MRVIYIRGVGHFIIQDVKENLTEADTKTITAFSLEYATATKYLNNFKINTGEDDSLEYVYHIQEHGVNYSIDSTYKVVTKAENNFKLTADELKDLDLAYAPPYSSAKDPVNMAGFVVDNIKNGVVKQFYYEDIPSLRERDDVILLDTRTPFEYMRGHAEDFINIPLDDLRERLGELDKTKKIYVMCQSGLRSYLATRILMQNGFDAYNFAGGFRLYSSIKNEEMLSKQCYTCGMEK